MWVLSTSRAELHYFTDSAAIPGGYAILSHTWTQESEGEQTFQDVRDIMKDCALKGQNPRDHVGEKIRRCCKVAADDGYDWIWLDSCCIDKTSSTELSEAINSMFDWYALAEVCYVFLQDVRHDDDPLAKDSDFRKARWHTRGWTLQELLAPAFVIFISQEWKPIGTKHSLCVPLAERTGISKEYLTREWDFFRAPIARRMSWAADRKTTRVEDEAYCLLGLFSVSMPTLYGEGQQAFQRLQVELAKQDIDTTLFIWGGWHNPDTPDWEQCSLATIYNGYHNTQNSDTYLFATSPSQFRNTSGACYMPRLISSKDVLQPYLPTQGCEEVRESFFTYNSF